MKEFSKFSMVGMFMPTRLYIGNNGNNGKKNSQMEQKNSHLINYVKMVKVMSSDIYFFCFSMPNYLLIY